MLAAQITVVQVLDMFEVRCSITCFAPGSDPERFSSEKRTYVLEEGWEKEDALSTIKTLLAIWSEGTINQ